VTRRASLAALATVFVLICGLQSHVIAATSASGPPTTPKDPGRLVRTTQIAPGVTYQRIYVKKIPRVTHVLTVDPSLASLEVAAAKPSLPGMATTSAMAAAGGALAAVNGDFGLAPGRPAHLFAHDGELYQTSFLGASGRGFGIPSAGGTFQVGSTIPHIWLVDGASVSRIDTWNSGAPGTGALAAFSSWGGSLEKPPSDSCATRLMPVDPAWSAHGSGMSRAFTVDAVRCGVTPMPLQGGVVVAARQTGVGAAEIGALAPGDSVGLRWTLGWTDVTDVIGGGFALVKDGHVSVDAGCLSYLCQKQPRTGVGITAEGKIIIIVVEGRYWRSRGVTPVQFAHMFVAQGAVDALNLDGGGSSTMVLDGDVVNFTSDGYERSVSSALLILPAT